VYAGYGWDCRWPKLHQWGQRKFRCIAEAEAKTFNDCHHGNTKDEEPVNATAPAVVARAVSWAA
jgi:hypothetical protein